MRGLLIINRYFVRKLKIVPRQQWVQRSQDSTLPFNERKIENIDIQYYQNIKNDIKLNISKYKAKPCSPKMGPYTITNPKIYDKMYKWCSCGQSLKQPFCDNSHHGTKFRPFKFTIEQNIKQIDLCGCKLTKKKPFCDGRSCKQLDPEVLESVQVKKPKSTNEIPKNQVTQSTNAAPNDNTSSTRKSRSKRKLQNKKEQSSSDKK